MTRLIAPAILLLAAGCDEFASDSGTETTDSGTAYTQADCDGVVLEDPEFVESPTTWRCTVRFDGDFRVSDVLTLEPCTRVEMGSRLFIQDGGRIEALGTPECPVVFTSQKGSPGAGDWSYIDFDGSADNANVFEHVVIEYGGDENGMLRGDGEVEIAFRDVTFQHSEALAVALVGVDVQDFARVHFADVPAHPMEIHGTDVGTVSEISVDAVQEPRILVKSGGGRGQLAENDTWGAQAIPYELVGDMVFEADFVVEPGAHLTAAPNSRYFVRDGGTFSLLGTEEAPIVFESANDAPNPGDWRQIAFDGDAGSGSVFQWATLRHAGDGFGAIDVAPDADLTLDNVTFEDNFECDVDDDGAVTVIDTTYVPCP